jgi:hypothetical protein
LYFLACYLPLPIAAGRLVKDLIQLVAVRGFHSKYGTGFGTCPRLGFSGTIDWLYHKKNL